MAKLGINMIEMYVKMVEAEFEPLIDAIESNESQYREQLELEVKKELGLYKLYEEKAVLEIRIYEIKSKLHGYEHKTHDLKYGYCSQIEKMVKKRLRSSKNGIGAEVRAARKKAINAIKLTGVSGDVKDVFDNLPDIITKLQKSLPAPKKLKKIGAK